MQKTADELFLDYYNKELNYLRNSGSMFARQYPKVARRLEISGNESPDPHVERLIESFAFLTARLSQEIDNNSVEVAKVLLDTLYPHLTNPFPSSSVALFKTDPSKGKLTEGYAIPRGTPLLAQADDGTVCNFQTCYDVTLWPLVLKNIALTPSNAINCHGFQRESSFLLKVTLESPSQLICDIELDSLSFFISAGSHLTYILYEELFAQKTPSIIVEGKDKSFFYLHDCIDPLGFREEESLCPTPPFSTHTYQLIQEYFHFPEKFLFFRVNGFKKAWQNLNLETNQLTLYFTLKDGSTLTQREIPQDLLRLGCTPIVNLFNKTTDPLKFDYKNTSYRLVPDQRRDRTHEIHSILKVSVTLDGKEEIDLQPFFSAIQTPESPSKQIYWYAKRKRSERDVPGTDTFISFVEPDFSPSDAKDMVVYAKTLCTNRFLASQLPSDAMLSVEDKAPTSKIYCLYKPTQQIYSPDTAESFWYLISQLSSHHLWLTQNEYALETIKKIFLVHATGGFNPRIKDLENLKSLQVKPTVKRFHKEAWRGFVEGYHIELGIEQPTFMGNSSVILCAILYQFFTQTVSINSFIELSATFNNKKEWLQWLPQKGTKSYL